MIILCPYCATELDVGDEVRSIVALCKVTNKTCDVKQWASPKTRVECKSDKDGYDQKNQQEVIMHVLQTDPPETEQEKATLTELGGHPHDDLPADRPYPDGMRTAVDPI